MKLRPWEVEGLSKGASVSSPVVFPRHLASARNFRSHSRNPPMIWAEGSGSGPPLALRQWGSHIVSFSLETGRMIHLQVPKRQWQILKAAHSHEKMTNMWGAKSEKCSQWYSCEEDSPVHFRAVETMFCLEQVCVQLQVLREGQSGRHLKQKIIYKDVGNALRSRITKGMRKPSRP